MKKISLSFFTVALILTGIFAFAGCEKEETINHNDTATIDKAKKLMTVPELAAFLGVETSDIVRVEHHTGYYHRYEHCTYENGQMTSKIVKTWCTPGNAYCFTKVFVKAGASVNSVASAEENPEENSGNGHIGFTKRPDGTLDEMIMIFDKDRMDASYLDGHEFALSQNRPIGNSNYLGLCQENEFVEIPAGTYELHDWGNFSYIRIPVSELVVITANLMSE